MSIEKLKEQARRHEQKEEWHKALDQYSKAIEKLAEEDQPDIGLYNRVGDLYVRVGNLDQAVSHYEQAVDLYMEAELPNNAIAVCKKVIRNVPDRHASYLKMGQIRAQQGFIPDARTNFLTYAERVAQAGEMDESLRALDEFTELVPEDTEVRLFLAEQLASHDREDEAVDHLIHAYHILVEEGQTEEAASVKARAEELDPGVDMSAPAAAGADAGMVLETGAGFAATEDEMGDDYGEFSLQSEPEEEEAAEALAEAAEEEAGVEIEEFEIGAPEEEAAEEPEEEAAELPMMDFGEEEDEAEDLPMMDVGLDEEEEGEAGELSMMDVDLDEDEEEAEELPMMEMDLDEDEEEAQELPMMEMDLDEDEEEAEELPMMEMDLDEGEEEAEELPLVDAGEHEEVGEEAEGLPTEAMELADEEPLPTMEAEEEPWEEEVAADEEEDQVLDAAAFGEADRGFREGREYVEEVDEMAEVDVGLSDLSGEEASGEAMEEAVEEAASEAAAELTVDEVRSRLAEDPDDISLHQRMVELAYGTGREEDLVEAYLGLARALERRDEPVRAKAAYQQVLDVDPSHEEARTGVAGGETPAQPVKEVAAHEDYVDLGSMILGDEEEKTTRFQVAYEEPSGDEEADFAKMLSQFKDKVSENLGADDVKAHHDLGTAYKEMGLLDEAVAEFQAALRADAGHLPTYELMGQTFMEMGHPEQAIRSLERALKVDYNVEDELLGIYYYLARAYEDQGNTEGAVEFYDRVFSLDINFADVTERLRALRPA